MTLERSVHDLRSRYTILGVIYLSRFFDLGGESYLYTSLRNLRQDSYAADQRILIVQDCDDQYDCDDLPGKAITALQKMLWEIDISNCFVIVVTANPGIEQELASAKTLYSGDSTDISFHMADGTYHKQQPTIESFCTLPWVHVYVGPQGDVLPCCFGDKKFPLGNVHESSVTEILQSDRANQLRSNMLAGKRTKECTWCWNLEDQQITSPRSKANQKWAEDKIKIQAVQSSAAGSPKSLDIRLSNLCNLKCRMCDSYYSSAIAQEMREIFGKITDPLPKSIRTETLDEIITFLPLVDSIYFAGGEPLMSAEHYAILEALVSCGNRTASIEYNTNFTVLKYKDKNAIDLWNNFANVEIHASIDAMGPQAQYIRHGTVWEKIERNLQDINAQASHVKFKVSSTLGFMNVENLIDLQKQWSQSGKISLVDFSVTVMTLPEYLTLRILPWQHKKRLETIINEHISWCQENSATDLAEQWKLALIFMWDRDDSHLLPTFRKITKQLDAHRYESFESIFPQYKSLVESAD